MDSATAWECLKEASLAFTPPVRFNDPFDTNPALDFNFREEQLDALSQHCPFDELPSPDRIREEMLRNRTDFMEHLIGAVCFTENENDPKMWSHYGDRHRGVMIGFDASHPELSKVEPVEYARERPLIGLEDSGAGKLLLVKSDIWTDEAEWRGRTLLAECEVKMIGGIPAYVRSLERNCFASITFGCKANEAFVVAVLNCLARWNLEHCEMWRVRLCDTTYKLIPRRIGIT